MTVERLIKRLSNLPLDAYVSITPIDYGDDAVIVIWSEEDGKLVKRGLPVRGSDDIYNSLEVIKND